MYPTSNSGTESSGWINSSFYCHVNNNLTSAWKESFPCGITRFWTISKVSGMIQFSDFESFLEQLAKAQISPSVCREKSKNLSFMAQNAFGFDDGVVWWNSLDFGSDFVVLIKFLLHFTEQWWHFFSLLEFLELKCC